MEALLQDLRLAVRQLIKSPAFSAVAVLTLATGIGANTAIFSAVNAVLLRPLPYPHSDRLVEVTSTTPEGMRFGVSYPDLLDLRGMTRDFAGVAAYSTERYNLTGAGDPREVQAAFVTADLFDVLGVQPHIGRPFTAAQDRDPVALLGYGLWATSFGSDPAILGKSIALDGKSYTVIGVMPAGFHFPDDDVQVWTPVGGILADEPQALTNRGFHALNAVARLAPQATTVQAQADLTVLAKRLASDAASDTTPRRVVAIGGGPGGPGGPGGGGPRVGSSPFSGLGLSATLLRDAAIGDVRVRLWVLLGAVGLVLLIACANTANLLLARAAGRRREMAIRRALGADRGRLIRQLLTESVLLALAAALGLAISNWGLDALIALWPRALPRSTEVGLDGAVLAFTVLLAVVTGIVFGLAPALRATAPRIEEALRDDAAGSGSGRRRRRLQGTLVVAEVALALVLLVGAGLLVRSFIALNRVNPGFDTQDVLAARVRLTPARYPAAPQQKEFFANVLGAVGARPDVAAAGLTATLPLSGSMRIVAFDPHAIRPDFPDPVMIALSSVVIPDYFSTLRIPIRRGRGFTADDRPGAPLAAVISARFARDLWPNADPIGKQFPLGGPRTGPRTLTVVGVVDDLRSLALDEAATRPALYTSALQEDGQAEMWVVMRSRIGSPLRLAGAIRDAVRLADPQQPIGDLVSLEQLIGRQTAARRFNTTLLGVFAALAVVLALVGIYGVTSYAVAQRYRELGIRMALGAKPQDVVRLLVNESLVRVTAGVVIGLAIALIATRALSTMLFGIAPQDAGTFTAMALLLAAVALLATWLPARRATRVDPMVTLRTE
jgi:putative ABC transport system permease protein